MENKITTQGWKESIAMTIFPREPACGKTDGGNLPKSSV